MMPRARPRRLHGTDHGERSWRLRGFGGAGEVWVMAIPRRQWSANACDAAVSDACVVSDRGAATDERRALIVCQILRPLGSLKAPGLEQRRRAVASDARTLALPVRPFRGWAGSLLPSWAIS